jgi:ABC-type molybdate transport system substrate-binding protein
VTDNNELDEMSESSASAQRVLPPLLVVALVTVAIIGGALAAKALAPRPSASSAPATSAAASLTSVHNDAVADYQAALKKGKPIYVLFHSLS